MGGRRELGGRGSRGAEVSWKGRGEGAGKLRNSEVKLRWWWVVVVGGGGMRGFSRQVDFVDLVNNYYTFNGVVF